MINYVVLTQYTNSTDSKTDERTDGRTPHDGIGRAYACDRAAKICIFNLHNSRSLIKFYSKILSRLREIAVFVGDLLAAPCINLAPSRRRTRYCFGSLLCLFVATFVC